VRLEWSVGARADRTRIIEYISHNRLLSALEVDERIGAIDPQLRRFPDSGRPGKVRGTRELVVQRTPYIAIYEIRDDVVFILRVIHGAQRWPPKD
jgi:toxin ParE1/3/4